MQTDDQIEEGIWWAMIIIAWLLLAGAMLTACVWHSDSAECQRSAYELERTRYRCTSEGELQTLDCGEWVTVQACSEPSDCSPGPDPECSQ